MTTTKYFSGETELTRITGMGNREFATRFPGVAGRKYDSFAMLVGTPAGHASVFVAGSGWDHGRIMPVDRVVSYGGKSGRAPSLHECDARCMFAEGRTMNCECVCGGKNHGHGGAARPTFSCS